MTSATGEVMKLKDKIAIVAGGTKGIGLGIAVEFAREGARVVIGGRNSETGAAGVHAIEQAGGEALFVKCDVAEMADLEAIVEAAVERFGRLDIYVANAGINDSNKTHFLDITPDQYDRIMGVNLKGMFFGGQKAAQQMIRQGRGGVIINMSSVMAQLALDAQGRHPAADKSAGRGAGAAQHQGQRHGAGPDRNGTDAPCRLR
jgi:glucose 1-dehydrogenase